MNCAKRTRRDFLTLAAAAAALSAWPASAETGRRFDADLAAFDQVWEPVRDRFYDPHLHGLDWQAARDRYRSRSVRALTRRNGRRRQCHAQDPGTSHTRYYTPDDPAYYQLADIFADALAVGLDRVFPGGEVTYPGIGFSPRPTIRAGLRHRRGGGRAPHQAGLLIGDELFRPTGAFRPVDSFRGKVGGEVPLSIRRAADGAPTAICVTPADPAAERHVFGRSEASARIIAGGQQRPDRLRPCLVLRQAQVSGGARGPDRRRSAAIIDAPPAHLSARETERSATPNWSDRRWRTRL